MATMQKKAWMEAQREIMITQATIAKPDSVFALGCFGTLTSGFPVGFTQGTAFNYGTKVSSYLSSSFNHQLGGAHTSAGSGTSINNCGAMLALWNAARCGNLDLPSQLLGTLQNIATYNRGAFPTACGSPGPWGSTGSATTPLGTIYGAKAANQSVQTTFDDMKLFAAVSAPLSQLSAPQKCAPGVPTGVEIAGGTPEVICPNPGCVSDGKNPAKCCDTAGANCN